MWYIFLAILGLCRLTMRDTSGKLLYPREYVTRIQLDSRQDWRTIRIGSRALVDLAESLEIRSAAAQALLSARILSRLSAIPDTRVKQERRKIRRISFRNIEKLRPRSLWTEIRRIIFSDLTKLDVSRFRNCISWCCDQQQLSTVISGAPKTVPRFRNRIAGPH